MAITGTTSSGLVVAIVNYNTSATVIKALPIVLSELQQFDHYHVVIVDNASQSEEVESLIAGIQTVGSLNIELVLEKRNRGFSAGNNVAFSRIGLLGWKPHAVFLLNPDAELVAGTLCSMVELMQSHPGIGVVGTRQGLADGPSWTAAFCFPTAMTEFASGTRLGFLTRRWPTHLLHCPEPVRVDWVSGAGMLIRWQAIEEVGGFDEGYFLYYEEVDFMLKLRRRGWETWHEPSGMVIHSGGAATGIVDGMPTSGRMPDYWFESWWRFFAKNHGSAYARWAGVLKVLGMVFGRCYGLVRQRTYIIAPGFLHDFLRKCVLIGSTRAAIGGPDVS